MGYKTTEYRLPEEPPRWPRQQPAEERTIPIYLCGRCPFDTFDEGRMKAHQEEEHLGAPAKAVSEAPEAAPPPEGQGQRPPAAATAAGMGTQSPPTSPEDQKEPEPKPPAPRSRKER